MTGFISINRLWNEWAFYVYCSRYIFESLGYLVASILISSVQFLKKINENGIKKMWVWLFFHLCAFFCLFCFWWWWCWWGGGGDLDQLAERERERQHRHQCHLCSDVTWYPRCWLGPKKNSIVFRNSICELVNAECVLKWCWPVRWWTRGVYKLALTCEWNALQVSQHPGHPAEPDQHHADQGDGPGQSTAVLWTPLPQPRCKCLLTPWPGEACSCNTPIFSVITKGTARSCRIFQSFTLILFISVPFCCLLSGFAPVRVCALSSDWTSLMWRDYCFLFMDSHRPPHRISFSSASFSSSSFSSASFSSSSFSSASFSSSSFSSSLSSSSWGDYSLYCVQTEFVDLTLVYFEAWGEFWNLRGLVMVFVHPEVTCAVGRVLKSHYWTKILLKSIPPRMFMGVGREGVGGREGQESFFWHCPVSLCGDSIVQCYAAVWGSVRG